MIYKYIVTDVSRKKIGLRFRPVNDGNCDGFIEVCGYGNNYELMEELLIRYCDKNNLPPPIWRQKNKCLYSFESSYSVFRNIVQSIKKSKMSIKQVKKLGNLIR